MLSTKEWGSEDTTKQIGWNICKQYNSNSKSQNISPALQRKKQIKHGKSCFQDILNINDYPSHLLEFAAVLNISYFLPA